MRVNLMLAAVLTQMICEGARADIGPTTNNRWHTERALEGSPAEQERKAAAEAKRQRKLAKARARCA